MLKAHCRCGHRIAVSDQYAGKRVKCPKCSGPVLVPEPKAEAAAISSAPASRRRPAAARIAPAIEPVPEFEPAPRQVDHQLIQQMRQQSRELARKSRNRIMAGMIGAIALVATLVTIVIVTNRKPEPTPESAKANKKNNASTVASAQPAVTPMNNSSTQDESAAPDTRAPRPGVGNEAAGDSDIAQAKVQVTPLAATATYDVAADRTTLQSIPTLLNVGDKHLKLVITLRHNGKSLREAFQMDAVLRVSGDFTGLVGLVIEGEPRLTIAIDGRDELELAPSGQDDAAGIKRDDGKPVLPNWVEYTLGKTEIVALARGTDIRTTLSGKPFKFTPEELALLGTFAPPAPKPEPPVKTEPAKPDTAGPDEVPAEKEVMDKKN